MYTEELLCIVRCDEALRKSVLGVFPIDRIPHRVCRGQALIINTDPHNRPGQHWVCCYVDEWGRGEFVDSYVHSPSYFSTSLKQFFGRNCSEYVYNTVQYQGGGTNVCGQYCIYFLMHRCRGVSMYDTLSVFSSNYAINDLYVYNYTVKTFPFCFL